MLWFSNSYVVSFIEINIIVIITRCTHSRNIWWKWWDSGTEDHCLQTLVNNYDTMKSVFEYSKSMKEEQERIQIWGTDLHRWSKRFEDGKSAVTGSTKISKGRVVASQEFETNNQVPSPDTEMEEIEQKTRSRSPRETESTNMSRLRSTSSSVT